MIETNVKESFLDLFYHDIEDLELDNNNKLNVFTLKIKNNSFAYDELTELLSNHIYHFALSRTEVEKLEKAKEYGTLVKKAKEKLRRYSSNEGELGEILLYCLLESHLNAPKILTKLEIKTAANDYVKGADGVHLLKLSDKDYQLIFGESKLNSDLQKGIYEAFGSLSNLITENKIDFEIGLVNSQLVKETSNEELYNFLKKVIIPSARESKINTDYSFGIFLGFDVEITKEESKKSNSDFRTYIRKKITKKVTELTKSVNFQINKSEFNGYDFYIYIIPFSNLKEMRKEIIKELT
ncbi:DUF1837 domain-containing protein [Maribellus sediminis]|uniref:HamA C-terminal domain-containing protein n=1 Tax=Maribellus sediminis TaxID=2696285 RepID=UPI0014306B7C|nr:DUF1837 domain-containing protein [Maribellus sediminis]